MKLQEIKRYEQIEKSDVNTVNVEIDAITLFVVRKQVEKTANKFKNALLFEFRENIMGVLRLAAFYCRSIPIGSCNIGTNRRKLNSNMGIAVFAACSSFDFTLIISVEEVEYYPTYRCLGNHVKLSGSDLRCGVVPRRWSWIECEFYSDLESVATLTAKKMTRPQK